ncbi:multidrug efflux SMR transporter [Pollutimonas sp. H1-120]|uniref:DMT family transporter n=1 Tax=Pollutimonas sp. H1-120 TaxID=3148824 RepID=UPI003B52A52A
MSWIYLAIAIAAEIIATTALKASDGFSRLYPSAITVAGYSVAFYCLALTLRVIPVGIAYAIWSGVGIVAISLIGYFMYKQTLDAAALLGIGLIVAGVVVLNVFSKSAMHG